ncbi:type II toxin-antitoxin system VapC family toxin [Paraburkholderia sp.]|uniref:type II toxin-antitoxin system VapC family toxin n=1 Tax=Paraburkholderia sp. TaxID=1926495 RepID=UPI0025DC2FD4|nr:type II toxin-antitoxin system VapC family toxin [Paraburkholderia sp.]
MIALDTLALIYWLSDDKSLTPAARAAIDHETDGGEMLVSMISVLEVLQFVDDGRLALSMDARSWLSIIVSVDYVRMVPVDIEIAFRAASLSEELSCEQRLIVATARTFGTRLVTPDARLRSLAHVETVW